MIKKVIVTSLFSIILVATSYFILFRKNSEGNNTTEQLLNFSPTLFTDNNPPSKTSVTNQPSGDYQLNYLIVRPTDIIDLYSNLEVKLTSSEARNKYGCESLISAGFYGSDYSHLGLFFTHTTLFSRSTDSSLFNGYLVIDQLGDVSISKEAPNDLNNIRIGLQSGPLLYISGNPVSIKTESRDMARRIIATTSNRGEISFISLHSKNNPISGPTLVELPNLIKKINQTTSLNINAAINLDGGSHSAFISGSTNITELALIGSFFCIKTN